MFIKKLLHSDGSVCPGEGCDREDQPHDIEFAPSRSAMAQTRGTLTEGASRLQAMHVLCQAEIPDSEVTKYLRVLTLLSGAAQHGLEKLSKNDFEGAREIIRKGILESTMAAEELGC